ncbi:Uncharacterised protein [Mycobacteroides abscessus subsp. massiliense]|uniref:hypothetical protein n=2 Tax=Mycobacteroides abscessus TaxID=36809 RepID=UPI000473D02F|nr:hypothetical protein [Mycobacteroides abscessus]SKM98500.1 Uncharacterised protein [Mycobacteroides abscessus subsp. massiliense]
MTTTITPMALAKPSLVRQRIGFGLIDRVPTTWTHKRVDPSSPDPKRPLIIETKMTGWAYKNPLAGNVSQLNVDRFIERFGV